VDRDHVTTESRLMRPVIIFDVSSLGKHMARSRYARGTLRTSVLAHGGRPERRLPRGEYLAIWNSYVLKKDGKEVRRRREKIIDRELAKAHCIAEDYTGPLTKSDAQRLLDLLIAADSGNCTPPDTSATLGAVAREYLTLATPSWGQHMVRAAGNLVENT
jgi:hypothetical protein